jgi:thymidine phosphorylase
LTQLIAQGAAWEKFVQFVEAQGGDLRYVYDPSLLPKSAEQLTLAAPQSGFVAALDALCIGQCSVKLGAGRTQQDSSIDKGAGIVLRKKQGDWVERGEPLAILHANSQAILQDVAQEAEAAWQLTGQQPVREPLIADIVHP